MILWFDLKNASIRFRGAMSCFLHRFKIMKILILSLVLSCSKKQERPFYYYIDKRDAKWDSLIFENKLPRISFKDYVYANCPKTSPCKFDLPVMNKTIWSKELLKEICNTVDLRSVRELEAYLTNYVFDHNILGLILLTNSIIWRVVS